MSSFQGVGIEEFHCIQRCSHFRVLDSIGCSVQCVLAVSYVVNIYNMYIIPLIESFVLVFGGV